MEKIRSGIIWAVFLCCEGLISCSENAVLTETDAVYWQDTIWQEPDVDRHLYQPYAIPVLFYMKEEITLSDSISHK